MGFSFGWLVVYIREKEIPLQFYIKDHPIYLVEKGNATVIMRRKITRIIIVIVGTLTAKTIASYDIPIDRT